MKQFLIFCTVSYCLLTLSNSLHLSTQPLFLHHTQTTTNQSISNLTNLDSTSTPPKVGVVLETIQTCKNIGSKWDSVTNTVSGITGTWTGSECNSHCQSQKGVVCGTILKDCCAMECFGSFFYRYCKFDLKLTRDMMKCGV